MTLLTPKDLHDFSERGWIQLPGLVDKESLIAAARNEAPTTNMLPEHEQTELTLEQFTPTMLSILDVVRPVCNQLLGRNSEVIKGMYSVLRENSLGFDSGKHWHIDGFGHVSKGGRWSEIPYFNLLVGVFLTDIPHPHLGNLMVLDGGHRIVAKWFQEIGCNEFDSSGNAKDDSELLKTLRQVKIPDLQPVTASPGDVVICHALMPHGIDRNDGLRRPVLYYRLGKPSNTGISALSIPWSYP